MHYSNYIENRSMKKFKKFIKIICLIILAIYLIYIVVVGILSILYNFVNPPITGLMIYRNIVSHYPIKAVKFVPLKSIPKSVQRMVILLEDSHFYKHYGIDFETIKESYRINKKYDKIIAGGSTITMQLARTLFLTPNRNYVRKYFEVIATLELELFLSKERILELYLNYVEYGKGIFGIQAASYYYYKRPISKISLDQYARLVTIIASPIKYNVYNLEKSKKLRFRYQFLQERYGIQ